MQTSDETDSDETANESNTDSSYETGDESETDSDETDDENHPQAVRTCYSLKFNITVCFACTNCKYLLFSIHS